MKRFKSHKETATKFDIITMFACCIIAFAYGIRINQNKEDVRRIEQKIETYNPVKKKKKRKVLKEIYVKREGNIPNDFNNVGCIRRGNERIDELAIGYCDTKSGKFLVFATPQDGALALQYWLEDNKDLTLERAISKYAPSNENYTEGYIQSVCKRTGLCRTDKIEGNEMALLGAIAKKEGFTKW